MANKSANPTELKKSRRSASSKTTRTKRVTKKSTNTKKTNRSVPSITINNMIIHCSTRAITCNGLSITW